MGAVVRGRRDGGGMAVLAGLSAAILYGISANYTQKRLSDVDPFVIATGSLIAATVLLLPLAIAFWPADAAEPRELGKRGAAWRVSAQGLRTFCISAS